MTVSPTGSHIVRDFGMPTEDGSPHTGIDLYAHEGAYVVSPRNGVLEVGPGGEHPHDNWCVIKVTQPTHAWYVVNRVMPGKVHNGPVQEGQSIGYVLPNANSIGPHIHLMVIAELDGQWYYVDPWLWGVPVPHESPRDRGSVPALIQRWGDEPIYRMAQNE